MPVALTHSLVFLYGIFGIQHICGASIDLIWAFSARGFDSFTCLSKFGIFGIQHICGASIDLIWVLLLVPVADTLDFVVSYNLV